MTNKFIELVKAIRTQKSLGQTDEVIISILEKLEKRREQNA